MRRADKGRAYLVAGRRDFSEQTREGPVRWMEGGDWPGRHGKGGFCGWGDERKE